MSTTAEKLQQIIDIKNDLKESINAKGGTIDDSTPFSEYAAQVDNLSTEKPSVFNIVLDDATKLQPAIKIQGIKGTFEINWGDGEKQTYIAASTSSGTTTKSTPYSSTGEYTVTVMLKQYEELSKSLPRYMYVTTASDKTTCVKFTSVEFQEEIYNTIPPFFHYKDESLTDFVIPKGLEKVKYIGQSAYSRCSNLTNLTIPSSIITIENFALNIGSSTNKATITFENETPCGIYSSTFDTDTLNKILVPDNSVEEYKSTANWRVFTKYIMGIEEYKTITITENGTYDVSEKSTAVVNVPAGITPSGTLEITENGEHEVSSYEKVNVNVESNIDISTIKIKIGENIPITYSAKTINVSNYYADYTNLTIDNFLLDFKRVEAEAKGLGSGEADITKTYNSSTGVFSVNRATINFTGTLNNYCDVYLIVPNEGDQNIEELTVTENGVYTPSNKVTAFSKVTVNVPIGITPSGTLEITENGEQDVTNYANVNVNVASSGGSKPLGKVKVNLVFPETSKVILDPYSQTTKSPTEWLDEQLTAADETTWSCSLSWMVDPDYYGNSNGSGSITVDYTKGNNYFTINGTKVEYNEESYERELIYTMSDFISDVQDKVLFTWDSSPWDTIKSGIATKTMWGGNYRYTLWPTVTENDGFYGPTQVPMRSCLWLNDGSESEVSIYISFTGGLSVCDNDGDSVT